MLCWIKPIEDIYALIRLAYPSDNHLTGGDPDPNLCHPDPKSCHGRLLSVVQHIKDPYVRKMDRFCSKQVSFTLSVTSTVALTNTLAYYNICTLRVSHVFKVHFSIPVESIEDKGWLRFKNRDRLIRKPFFKFSIFFQLRLEFLGVLLHFWFANYEVNHLGIYYKHLYYCILSFNGNRIIRLGIYL
jgi:hypothetical protein